MTEFEKLPKRVRRVIETVRSGQILCRQYRPRAVGDDTAVQVYWFEPAGRDAPPASSRQAIAEGYLTPLDNGLLNDGNGQSFTAAQV